MNLVNKLLLFGILGAWSWRWVWMETGTWWCVPYASSTDPSLFTNREWIPFVCCNFRCHWFRHHGRTLYGV